MAPAAPIANHTVALSGRGAVIRAEYRDSATGQATCCPHIPQTPVAGTSTKQSGQRTAARSGIDGAAAFRGAGAAARARRARSGAETGGASLGVGLWSAQ